jgi:hypothetical protein
MAYVIRRSVAEDRPALDALHLAHGTQYWYADPDDPINFETWVIEVDGKIVCALTARLTAEGFLMLDKSFGTPAERWELTKQMLEHSTQRAHELGFREIHIGVAPNERGWLRRLLSLPSMFLDNRFHVILAVWQRFRRT